MADVVARSTVDEQLEHEEAFPRLSAELVAALDAVGRRRALVAGEVLHREGEVAREFYVVVRGSLAGYADHGRATQRRIAVIGERRFLDELRRVIGADQRLGDLILGAFVARRALLVGMGTGVRLVGSPLSPQTRRLRDFLTRNRIPHGFVDVETDVHAEHLLREFGVAPAETPLVLGGSFARATRPTARSRVRSTSGRRGRRPASPTRSSSAPAPRASPLPSTPPPRV